MAYSTPGSTAPNRFVSIGSRDNNFLNIPQQTQVTPSPLFLHLPIMPLFLVPARGFPLLVAGLVVYTCLQRDLQRRKKNNPFNEERFSGWGQSCRGGGESQTLNSTPGHCHVPAVWSPMETRHDVTVHCRARGVCPPSVLRIQESFTLQISQNRGTVEEEEPETENKYDVFSACS
ncbi:hypothetical protein DNTS_017926 [Danionella cerebrum]|uniref:Uncharacterized protein n=1 Tax=Danionella cerebrum TaxID=2873325 RepID=A0A553MSD4_9TELE|nr:hypothetical protein DNTS_017926 [Danionella translucida]